MYSSCCFLFFFPHMSHTSSGLYLVSTGCSYNAHFVNNAHCFRVIFTPVPACWCSNYVIFYAIDANPHYLKSTMLAKKTKNLKLKTKTENMKHLDGPQQVPTMWNVNFAGYAKGERLIFKILKNIILPICSIEVQIPTILIFKNYRMMNTVGHSVYR